MALAEIGFLIILAIIVYQEVDWISDILHGVKDWIETGEWK